jgi:hypothetical protein
VPTLVPRGIPNVNWATLLARLSKVDDWLAALREAWGGGGAHGAPPPAPCPPGVSDTHRRGAESFQLPSQSQRWSASGPRRVGGGKQLRPQGHGSSLQLLRRRWPWAISGFCPRDPHLLRRLNSRGRELLCSLWAAASLTLWPAQTPPPRLSCASGNVGRVPGDQGSASLPCAQLGSWVAEHWTIRCCTWDSQRSGDCLLPLSPFPSQFPPGPGTVPTSSQGSRTHWTLYSKGLFVSDLPHLWSCGILHVPFPYWVCLTSLRAPFSLWDLDSLRNVLISPNHPDSYPKRLLSFLFTFLPFILKKTLI